MGRRWRRADVRVFTACLVLATAASAASDFIYIGPLPDVEAVHHQFHLEAETGTFAVGAPAVDCIGPLESGPSLYVDVTFIWQCGEPGAGPAVDPHIAIVTATTQLRPPCPDEACPAAGFWIVLGGVWAGAVEVRLFDSTNTVVDSFFETFSADHWIFIAGAVETAYDQDYTLQVRLLDTLGTLIDSKARTVQVIESTEPATLHAAEYVEDGGQYILSTFATVGPDTPRCLWVENAAGDTILHPVFAAGGDVFATTPRTSEPHAVHLELSELAGSGDCTVPTYTRSFVRLVLDPGTGGGPNSGGVDPYVEIT